MIVTITTALACIIALIAVFERPVYAQDGFEYTYALYNLTGQSSDTEGFAQLFLNSWTANNQIHVQLGSMDEGSFYMSVDRVDPRTAYQLNTQQSGPALILPFNATYTGQELNYYGLADNPKDEYLTSGIPFTSPYAMDSYAIKIDPGTTDGMLILPMTQHSNEFFIAGWPVTIPRPGLYFYTGLMVIASAADTCGEVYVVQGNQYRMVKDFHLKDDNSVFQMTTTDPGGDYTGYYINTTKPVQVTSGAECAAVPLNTTRYCDHMVESLPPVKELGTVYIVPPIAGRLFTNVGYIIRVVATDMATAVTANYADGTPGIVPASFTLDRGQFMQLDSMKNMVSTVVVCSKPCLVMQYNKGYQYIETQVDVPTDPFMMLTVPVDHFMNQISFTTPNYCIGSSALNEPYLINFNNFISIITQTSMKASIRVDMANPSATANPIVWSIPFIADGTSYVAGTMPVSHSSHNITVVNGSAATFGAYLYGHSPTPDSTSAYGFILTYKLNGPFIQNAWHEAKPVFEQQATAAHVQTCSTDAVITGAYILSMNPINLGFSLTVTVATPNSVSTACQKLYQAALQDQATSFMRQINQMICNMSLCYAVGGTGVAINIASITVTTITTSTGLLTGFKVNVPLMAASSAKVDSFARCSKQLKTLMQSFANWPLGVQLIPTVTGCTQLTYVQQTYSIGSAQCG